MTIGTVSFGRVTAVTGNEKKTNKLNNKMYRLIKNGEVLKHDVTDKYKNSSSDGSIAKAVRNGERALVYVTGDDVGKISRKDPGWGDLDMILTQMSRYIDLRKVNVSEAFDIIV